MSEQAPPSEETPTIASPETGTPGSQQTPEEIQAEIDYRKRYEDMRPEFDRKSQRLAEVEPRMGELEQRNQWLELLATTEDPDTRRQAAQALGYEIADEQPEYADPQEELAARLAALEGQIQQRDQQAQQDQQVALVEQHVEQSLDALGLDQEDRDWVASKAFAMPPKTAENGLMVPDIQAAHEAFQAWEQARQQKWAKTKRAPHFSPVGEAGTQQPDLSTREGKTAYILSRMQAEET